MKAITLFACFVLVYADPDQQTPASNWSPLENTVVGIYQPVNLTCSFRGEHSDSQATWKKNGRDLLNSSKTSDLRLQDRIDMYLNIENTTLDDTATYKCIINSTTGLEFTISQKLTVTKTPALTMKPLKPVEVLEDSYKVLLEWNVVKTNFAPEYYKIERATENAAYLDPEQIDKDTYEKSIEIPKDQTAYRFRIHAFAGKELHISPYSEWIDTKSEKKYKYVPKFEVTNTTENWIKITWKGPSQEYPEKVDYYEIKVDNKTHRKNTQQLGTEVIHQLYNLTCGTNYTIDVAACSSGQLPDECSIWSGEKSVRTKECKNAGSAASFQQKANGILVTMIGLCFLNKYHA